MSKISLDMHRLVRITLVNWYLFEYEDISIDVDVAYFKGVNGAGKSSLADALQAIFAGGDETKIALNAASSDNKQSGRTLLSYVLGVVAESGGMRAVKPRQSSNCYLCVTFQRPDESYYSFGLSMHARATDSKVKKERFIVDGQDLSSIDFMEGQNSIVPWSTMQKRLINMPAKVFFPNNASEYRRQYCELMSGSGINAQISADMMLQAFKNGIAFKEQKSINEFICNYILPKNDIDVDRIDNDYQEYKKIQDLIEKAEDKLGVLNTIIASYKRYKQKLESSQAYRWCELEAICCNTESQLNAKEDSAETLEKLIVKKGSTIKNTEANVTNLLGLLDEAKRVLHSSDDFAALKENQSKLEADESNISKAQNLFNEVTVHVRVILDIKFPTFSDEKLSQQLNALQDSLLNVIGDTSDELIEPWYYSLSSVESALVLMRKFEGLVGCIKEEAYKAKRDFETIQNKFSELRVAHEKAKKGKVSLTDSTTQVIDLLASYGIEATPVCDLASISDKEWQVSIESFLRSNREALVINPEDYGRAINIYRKEKNRHKRIRQAKLINPDKGFGFEKTPDQNSAASLINSDNYIALKFLRGLLHNVKLVETEDELRREKRAITKDGMVAGNGAISGGGNLIPFVMLGSDARRYHASMLETQIQELAPTLGKSQELTDQIEAIDNFFNMQITQASNKCASLPSELSTFESLNESIIQTKSKILKLENDGNKTLNANVESAQLIFDTESERLGKLKIEIALANKNMEDLQVQISILSKRYDDEAVQRKQYEAKGVFSNELVNEKFTKLTKLTNALGDDNFNTISNEARKHAEADLAAANKARQKAGENLASYNTTYEPEDKKELAQLSNDAPLEALIRCEEHAKRIEDADLVIYLSESRQARETMLHNFRAEVVANLKECFQQIKHTFTTLNTQLKTLTFNNNKYQFLYPETGIESLKAIYDHVTDTSDLDNNSVGDLFDENKDDPAIKIIEDLLVEGRLHEISDYRNFYSYDIQSKDTDTDTTRNFSELLKTGSGGEKQAPFYVALGASFMTAYKIRKTDSQVVGGAAIAVFDEAFSKMDGNNAKAALAFFREIGLQVIIAAPPESEIKTGPYVDKTYTILRNGDRVYIDNYKYKDKGKQLLESDDHNINPEVLVAILKDVKSEFEGDTID
jgi:hypothetical protein